MIENITFRQHLLGRVVKFVNSCRMPPLVRPPVLVDLIIGLARHHEEGEKYFAEVYLCENIETVVKLLPGYDVFEVGEISVNEDFVSEILKKCIPLAIERWSIYIEHSGKTVHYGLFHGALTPLAVPVDDVLLVNNKGVKIVKIHQTSNDCIEIRNHRGDHYRVFLSDQKESEPVLGDYLHKLTAIICAGVKPSLRDSVKTFIRKALIIGLNSSHGTLIVVCPSLNVPKFLSDGVILKFPIHFSDLVEQTLDKKLEDEILLSQIALLRGMINCDGIVVFSRAAQLLAYNVFITSQHVKQKPVIGGARKRAFESLRNKLGRGIDAVYVQSQDGWTNFRKRR